MKILFTILYFPISDSSVGPVSSPAASSFALPSGLHHMHQPGLQKQLKIWWQFYHHSQHRTNITMGLRVCLPEERDFPMRKHDWGVSSVTGTWTHMSSTGRIYLPSWVLSVCPSTSSRLLPKHGSTYTFSAQVTGSCAPSLHIAHHTSMKHHTSPNLFCSATVGDWRLGLGLC